MISFTDNISLVSGSRIGNFDPFEVIYSEKHQGQSKPFHWWNMKKDLNEMKRFGDQWEPFYQDIFGFGRQGLESGR